MRGEKRKASPYGMKLARIRFRDCKIWPPVRYGRASRRGCGKTGNSGRRARRKRPSGAKAPVILPRLMYGLKPVPSMAGAKFPVRGVAPAQKIPASLADHLPCMEHNGSRKGRSMAAAGGCDSHSHGVLRSLLNSLIAKKKNRPKPCEEDLTGFKSTVCSVFCAGKPKNSNTKQRT